jgi:4'-phosphopantetheinyl transferase
MLPALVPITVVPLPTVNIWSAHLDSFSPAEIQRLTSYLSNAEAARAQRFHFESDKRHYVISHGLIRHLLGATLNRLPQELAFQYGPYGKPTLAPEFSVTRSLCFNLSHSAGWAMFALSWEREIGIDLESACRLKGNATNLSALAARVLAPREMIIWETLSDSGEREGAFLRAWTRKEAYAKAKGEGIFTNLSSIEVVLDMLAPRASLTLTSRRADGESEQEWVLHDLPAPHEFAAAIVVSHS